MFFLIILLFPYVVIADDLYLWSKITTSPGSLGSRATTNSACSGVAHPTFVCSSSVKSFLSFSPTPTPSPDTLASVAASIGVTPTTIVKGPTGGPVGPWGPFISSPTTTPLSSVGISSSTFWTGATLGGGEGADCSIFLGSAWTVSTSSGTGVAGANSGNAINFGGKPTCDNSLTYLCMCLVATSSPTNNPSNKPTKNPTKHPSKNPTKNPTKFPTPPTKKPTKNPTNNPSKNPTKTPTTQTPTLHPSPNPLEPGQPIQVRYLLQKGSLISVEKTTKELTINIQKQASTPFLFNITTTNSYVPVLWRNLLWTSINASGVINQSVALCNPIPTPLPGHSVVGIDGYIICPTIYSCPSISGVTIDGSGYLVGWGNLRACVLSYEIEIRTDIPTITGRHELLPVELNTTLTSLPVAFTLGFIHCNDAVERELNCQFSRQFPSYSLQCGLEPITCYKNETIGKYFGLFYNQNPLFRYDIPQEQWSLSLYKGIASIINNKIYLKNGQWADPLSPELMNDYYWLPNISFSIISKNYTSIWSNYSVRDVLQTQPYQWDLKLQPSTNYSSYLSQNIITCLDEMYTFGTTISCSELTWENIHDFIFRFPSLISIIYSNLHSKQLVNAISLADVALQLSKQSL
jgi:hypothetical protein